jgi:aspartate aminotransferase-like enzyme
MGWSKPYESSPMRAADQPVIAATRRSPSEFGQALPSAASNRRFRHGESSVVLRAYRLPLMTYQMLHDALKAEGFVIYAGQSGLSSTLFRISTMGNLSAGDIDRLLQCFARLLE